MRIPKNKIKKLLGISESHCVLPSTASTLQLTNSPSKYASSIPIVTESYIVGKKIRTQLHLR